MTSTRTHSRRSDQSLSDRSRYSSTAGSARSRSYKDGSDEYSSDYSDDFKGKTKSIGQASARTDMSKKSTGKHRRHYASDHTTIGLHSSATSHRSSYVYGNLRKKKRARPVWKSSSGPRTRSVQRVKTNSIATHMLAAKQQELNDLRNQFTLARQKLDAAEKENKLMKTLQHRQDKAIRKYENAENELPQLISRNFEDQRVLKAKLRKTLETKRALESKLTENNEEMAKIEGVLCRLKKLVYDKNLGERSELSKQLSETEGSLSAAERKIKELGKKLDLATGSYTRQLNTERLKHKETKEKMEKLDQDFTAMDTKLKEKERALNVSNIYVMRRRVPPEKALALITSTPKQAESISTQTDLSLALYPEVKGQNSTGVSQDYEESLSSSPSLNRLHSDTSKTALKRDKRGVKNSVFLTADFDSPSTSPTASFSRESRLTSDLQPAKPADESLDVTAEMEDSFASDLKKTESEIKKLQVTLKQKADLLSKMQEIDSKEPGSTSPVLLKASPSENTLEAASPASKLSPRSKAELVQSLLGNHGVEESTNDLDILKPSFVQTTAEPPKKPEREISFGSYAPTVGGVAKRKPPLGGTKSSKKPATSSFEVDEPMFDLSSGKQNKKSDLLAQLFGNKDALLVSSNTSLN